MRAAQIDEDALKARAADGMNSHQMADEFGVSRGTIVRRLDKLGVSFNRNPPKIKTCREQIKDMKSADAIEYLLDVIEMYSAAQDLPLVTQITQHGFTATESQILTLVFYSESVTKGRIYYGLYQLRGDDSPDPKVVDVLICKLRAKLKKTGWPVKIETIWGVGYKGVRPADFDFPWEM